MERIRSNQVSIFFAATLALILLISLLARSAYAAVTLLYFRANIADPVIRLEWATATELDTSGFYIGRGQSASGPFTHLPNPDNLNGFVWHQGDGIIGAEYVLTDTNVQNGVMYYYRLEEVDIHNAVSYYGPITAGINVALPTNTPRATSTSTATPKPTRDPNSVGNNFTPTPQARGLDPSNFTLVTSIPVVNSSSPVSTPDPQLPSANDPAKSPSDQNNISPLPPSAPQVEPAEAQPIAQNNSASAPSPDDAPNSNESSRVAVAPLVVAAPNSIDSTTPAASNGSLFGVLLVLILLVGAGGVYAIQRRAKS